MFCDMETSEASLPDIVAFEMAVQTSYALWRF